MDILFYWTIVITIVLFLLYIIFGIDGAHSGKEENDN